VREEGAIARTPKTTEKKATPAARPAATAKPAAKAKSSAKAELATKAKPAAKATRAAKAPAPAKPTARSVPAGKTSRSVASGAAATPKRPAAPKAGSATRTAPARPAKAAATNAAAAGAAPTAPRPPRGRKREKLAPDRLELLVTAAMKSLEDDKAEDIVLLDVTGRADYADRLIVATGKVERQLQAMAQHLDEALGKAGLSLRRDSIQASPDWVLIDAGDLVIHLFRPEARELYRIERMWGPESPGASNAAPG
jgi:ribosome-associated protein